MSLHLEIVTPERRIFSEEVDDAVIPGAAGELGFLPRHTPLITTLEPGELRYRQGSKEHFLAVGEGIAEIHADYVNVITDLAVSDDEIDEGHVKEALARARKALEERTERSREEIAAVQASIQKSLAQLKLKRRRRGL